MVESAILLDELGRAAYPGPYWPTVLAPRPSRRPGPTPRRSVGSRRSRPASARATWRSSTRISTGTRGDVGARREDAQSWRSPHEALVPWRTWPRAADSPRAAPRADPVPRRSLGVGPHLSPVQGMDPATRWCRSTWTRCPRRRTPCSGPSARPSLAREPVRRGRSARRRKCWAPPAGVWTGCRLRQGTRAVRQPIGSFQGDPPQVRRDAARDRELALRRLLRRLGARRHAEDGELAASIAKAYVGDAARKVCGEAIQLHGGIGFTWEYDLHIYMKRAKALEPMYGDADYHSRADRPARREVAELARPVSLPRAPLDAVRVVDLTSYIAARTPRCSSPTSGRCI